MITKQENSYYFHILNYKTSSNNRHASFSYQLDDKLSIILSKHLINVGNTNSLYPLLLNSKGNPFVRSDDKSRHKTCSFIGYFKYLYYNRSGKIVTPTVLRKSIVTDMMNKKTSETEMKELAEAMLHTYYTQQRYYSKLSSQQRANRVKNLFDIQL